VFGWTDTLLSVEIGALLAGFAYAGASDLRTREVPDLLWQALGAVGLLTGAFLVAPGGLLPVVLWLLVAALTLQHMFSWDLALGAGREGYADLLELIFYVITVAVVAAAALRDGIGASGVPYAVLACLATVLFARGLFEAGVLYGGGDAKALMTAGVLLPTFATPVLYHPAALAPVVGILPYSVDLLMDAAILSIGIPIVIAIRNVARGEFHDLRGFTGYLISVDELPHRFVWIRDPTYGSAREAEDEIETSEEDRQHRIRIAEELRAKGVARVWVTPQIPFVVLMALGALMALLAGNLALDLASLL